MVFEAPHNALRFSSTRLSAQSKLYPQGTAPRYFNGLPTEKYFWTHRDKCRG